MDTPRYSPEARRVCSAQGGDKQVCHKGRPGAILTRYRFDFRPSARLDRFPKPGTARSNTLRWVYAVESTSDASDIALWPSNASPGSAGGCVTDGLQCVPKLTGKFKFGDEVLVEYAQELAIGFVVPKK